MSGTDARARMELTIQKQLSRIWGAAIEAARQPEMGCITDADGLANYQRDRDRAIQQAARAILASTETWGTHFAADQVVKAVTAGRA